MYKHEIDVKTIFVFCVARKYKGKNKKINIRKGKELKSNFFFKR